jgi:hypothetical protein
VKIRLPRDCGWILSTLAVCVLLGPDAWATVDPAALLAAVRHNRLDAARAVELRDTEIPIGIARLRVEHALLIPTRPIDGRTVEFVLLGSAWFEVDPPDEIEAGQLELFTGRRKMDARIDAAVLVFVDQQQVASWLSGPAAEELDQESWEQAEATYARWLDSVERRTTGAEAGIFKAIYGDTAYRDYFAVWCLGREAGEWVYTYDPEDAEQLTIAAFNRPQVNGWDRVRLARHIRFQQRKGRYLGMRLEDLGAWDIWLSTPWSPRAVSDHGSFGFETRHYELKVRVLRNSLELEGEATLHLETTVPGRRTVSLELFRDLEIASVRDGSGRELYTFRSGPEVLVCLPDLTVAGQQLLLRVEYSGRVLEWRGKGTYDLIKTDGWYPHCGSIDRATYDVTLHWPRKYDLLAGGKLVDSGEHGRYRWQRRVLDIPSIAFSFVVGKYDIVERQIDDTRLRLAFSRSVGKPTPTVRERTVDVISRSLAFLEEAFGPYPLDELTVVILPRGYSQSFLGFVVLNDTIAGAAAVEPYTTGQSSRETTIAHELAHQWWGNLVGWWSYRDQWLSEAMANYAGMLFHVRSSGGGTALLAEMSAGWRAALERKIDDGRTIESLGPIVLGSRLNSSRAANGYGAIVYRKGAVVLAMLARAVGEERFLEMLRSLVDSSMGEVITTADFVSSIERMSGLDLGGFAQQYVYGTGIPRVYYEYEVGRDETEQNAWRLHGEARRLIEARYSSRVEHRADGSWDVVRSAEPEGTRRGTAVMVPFRIVPRTQEVVANNSDQTPSAQTGRLMLSGTSAQFVIESQVEPDRLIFDPWGEILAHFYSFDSRPKRVARYRGQDLLLEGRPGAAERELLGALDQPLGAATGQAGVPWLWDAEAEERQENASIRLTLARLYIDQGQDDRAEQQMIVADELLAERVWDRRLERQVLWARLELRDGRPESVYKRLKPTLGLALTGRGRSRDRQTQLQLRAERLALTDAYALLAVAAYQTRHMTDYEWALAGALEQGVDMSQLVPVARTAP